MNPCLRQVTRLLSDIKKEKTEGRFNKICTERILVYIIFLKSVPSLPRVHILFHLAFLLQFPSTVKKHEDQLDWVL